MRGRQDPFVLAISASPRGFAFVFFQGSERPFDWGVKAIWGSNKNVGCMKAVKSLIEEVPTDDGRYRGCHH
jgi:hypothetical protein